MLALQMGRFTDLVKEAGAKYTFDVMVEYTQVWTGRASVEPEVFVWGAQLGLGPHRAYTLPLTDSHTPTW